MTRFAGFDVEVPFGPAAGAVNGPNEELLIKQLLQVIHSPAGFALAGSFTTERSEGNAHYGRTYYHDPLTGRTVNSMGLPNVGSAAAEQIIGNLAPIAADYGKPLGASVSPAKGEDPQKVLPDLVYRMFAAGAHFVEANYSCPNKVTDDGGREPMLGYDPDAVGEVREAILSAIGHQQHFGEKWPPPIAGKLDIARKLAGTLYSHRGVYFISGPNTVKDQKLYDEQGKPALDVPGHVGGMSGPATAPLAREMARQLDQYLPLGVKILSASGVMTGQEVYERTTLGGVSLAAGVTVYFENEARGIDYGKTGVRIAEEYLAAREVAIDKE